MSSLKVRQYVRIVRNVSTGDSYTEVETFTQVQASEIGAVVEPDGLNVVAAQRLCARWTRLGSYGSIQYSYAPHYADEDTQA